MALDTVEVGFDVQRGRLRSSVSHGWTECLEILERFTFCGLDLGQMQVAPKARHFGAVALAQVAEEIAFFVVDAALDEQVGQNTNTDVCKAAAPSRAANRWLQVGGLKPRDGQWATNVARSTTYLLATITKNKTTISPVRSKPRSINTTRPPPKNTPSNMSPNTTIFRISRFRSSVIIAALASI